MFAALAGLTLISISWSVQPADSWVEANRTFSYLAAFGAGLALARLAPRRWAGFLGAIALTTSLVSGYALLVKVFPATLDPSEILVQVRIPLPGARTGSAYEKLPHPASRFAVVGVAAAVTLDGKGAVQRARVALTGLGPKVSRAASVEQALQGKATSPESLQSAAARAAEGLELRADATGSADYKAHLAALYTERALRRAVARAVES